jgi:two-component system cell cycle response regulator DivK
MDDIRRPIAVRASRLAVADMPPERDRKASTRPRRALVVAADSLTHRICRAALESSGLVVEGVESGMEALMSAREVPPDLIVVDQQLRDVSGNEAIGWLRANAGLRATPIIVLTTGTDDDALAAAAPFATLRKPLSPLAIRRTIRAVLA